VKTSFIILLSLTVFPLCGGSQAVLSSLMEVKGLQLYEDLKDVDKFYYAPGKLQLHHNEDGRPTFKLIEMRYTGTSVTGNQGEKRFTNIVQFKVVMQQYDKAELADVKKQLSAKAVLRPLALTDVDAQLIAPFQGTYKSIGKGVFDSESKSKKRKGGFWTERVFTVRLENHEAQLLWDMVENGQLSISMSYAYYADIINDVVMDVNSDSDSLLAELKDLKEKIEKRDTVLTSTLIHSDAFGLDVDVNAYPDLLVKKDLNSGGVPPAYPALQVACFDFYNDLRTDLLMKTIEFQATGLNDNTVKIRPMKFLGVKKDLHTQQLRFPYAVDMTKPLRYKIKEFSMDGEFVDKGWKTADSWMGILDITSQTDDIKSKRRDIEFEVDLEDMKANEIVRYDVVVEYKYIDYLFSDRITFTTDDALPLKQLTVLSDIDSDITYRIYKTKEKRRYGTMDRIVAIDDYVFINMDK